MNSSTEAERRKPFFVFLDRDGTLIVEKNYLEALDQIEFIPGSEAAVARLRRAGAKVIVVSNQSGVGRGYFTAAFVQQTHEFLQAQLQTFGTRLDAVYFCPLAPERDCACRKPKTGMLEEAARDFQMPLRGYLVGDRASDLEAGRRAGLRSILVRTGYGEDTLQRGEIAADFVATDLREASAWILRRENLEN